MHLLSSRHILDIPIRFAEECNFSGSVPYLHVARQPILSQAPSLLTIDTPGAQAYLLRCRTQLGQLHLRAGGGTFCLGTGGGTPNSLKAS
jgi:hypothetical protein